MPSVERDYLDVGAPQLLGNTPGTLLNLLKAVLVDGYGAFPSLGWELYYEDIPNNRAVFRLGGGTKFFVYVDDNNYFTDNYKSIYIRGYESMPSINEGISPCPELISNKIYQPKTLLSTNSSNPIPWRIIGDEKGFYLLVRVYQPQYADTNYGLIWRTMYVGDYIPYDLSNKHNFMTLVHDSSNPTYDFQRYNDSSIAAIIRDPWSVSKGSMWVRMMCFMAGNGALFGNQDNWPSLSPMNGRHLYDHVQLHDTEKKDSGLLYGYRILGWMPGFLNQWWSPNDVAVNINRCSDAELTPFYDELNNHKIYCFPAQYRNENPNTQNSHRYSIIVGDGFRNAY